MIALTNEHRYQLEVEDCFVIYRVVGFMAAFAVDYAGLEFEVGGDGLLKSAYVWLQVVVALA